MNISIVSVLIIFLCDVSRDAKLLLIDSLIFLYLSFLIMSFKLALLMVYFSLLVKVLFTTN
ncbi:hypothetical protein EJW77_05760 [Escherichia coli]|nr:hypothetical protein [Escherichia coli]EFC3927630.1 hypothetical protein [Escherichia coli]